MGNQAEATNYYEVLEVSTDAPPHEIHRAYQRAKSTYSSENPALYSMFSADEARELLRLIEEAYSVLGNPSLRKNYDEARLSGNGATLSPRPQAFPAFERSQEASSGGQYAQPAFKDTAKDIVSVHQALPDFSTPSVSVTVPSHHSSNHSNTTSRHSREQSGQSMSTTRTVPNTAPRAPLAPGMARTTLSTYKIDENFETEVNGAIDWDGTLLQRVRLYKNISIDSLSDATRISRPYLMAVETNDFKNLPAAVFVRGFVVQMARLLGLNDAKVASSYIKIFKAGGGK